MWKIHNQLPKPMCKLPYDLVQAITAIDSGIGEMQSELALPSAD